MMSYAVIKIESGQRLSPIRLLAALALLLALQASPVMASKLHAVEWRLENPFRLFKSPEHVRPHIDAFRATFHRNQRSPILAAERWLSARHPRGWAERSFAETCWSIWRKQFSACGGLRPFVFPRHHRVTARLKLAVGQDRQCIWQIRTTAERADYRRDLPSACDAPVRFRVPYPQGAVVTVVDQASDRELAVKRIAPRDVFIVGMGDSFASGDGNPDYPVKWRDDQTSRYGTIRFRGQQIPLNNLPKRQESAIRIGGRQIDLPTSIWHSQSCHRSLYSHQFRVALQIALEDPHRAVTFVSLACSGAEIVNGLFLPNAGVERSPKPMLRSQIGEAAVIQCGGQPHKTRSYVSAYNIKGAIPELDTFSLERCPRNRARRIDVLLVTIGGNDIGFAKLVANTILIDRTPLRALAKISNTLGSPLESRRAVASLRHRMHALRRAIHNHLHMSWDQPHRIILTEYPTIGVMEDGRATCPTSNAGMDIFPLYRLDAARLRSAEAIAEKLAASNVHTTRRFGWSYVDAHRKQFAGRGLCAGHLSDALDDANDLRVPRWNGQRWTPFNPSAFLAYAPRSRWIRTPNDAFMIAHLHLLSDLKLRIRRNRGLSARSLMESSTYSGAFHPTAEGQAAIADAVLPIVRSILRE